MNRVSFGFVYTLNRKEISKEIDTAYQLRTRCWPSNQNSTGFLTLSQIIHKSVFLPSSKATVLHSTLYHSLGFKNERDIPGICPKNAPRGGPGGIGPFSSGFLLIKRHRIEDSRASHLLAHHFWIPPAYGTEFWDNNTQSFWVEYSHQLLYGYPLSRMAVLKPKW